MPSSRTSHVPNVPNSDSGEDPRPARTPDSDPAQNLPDRVLRAQNGGIACRYGKAHGESPTRRRARIFEMQHTTTWRAVGKLLDFIF